MEAPLKTPPEKGYPEKYLLSPPLWSLWGTSITRMEPLSCSFSFTLYHFTLPDNEKTLRNICSIFFY